MSIPRLRLALILAASFGTSGCIAAGHTSSPWEFGGGIRVAPRLAETASGLMLHPMAGYTYLSFDGGHDGLWEVGGQVRKPLASSTRGLWIGGEAALSVLRTGYDTDIPGISGSSNTGFALTALLGRPVGQSRWGFNLFGGAGVSHYGGTGFNVRVGVDLQPWFLND